MCERELARWHGSVRTRWGSRSKGSARSKANVEEASAKIVAHVQSNDGQGIRAISDATGVDLKTAKKAAIALLAAGSLTLPFLSHQAGEARVSFPVAAIV